MERFYRPIYYRNHWVISFSNIVISIQVISSLEMASMAAFYFYI